MRVVSRTVCLLFKGLAALAVGLCAFNALAGVNEPDYYVQWVGFGSQKKGPYINTGYAFTKMPLVEVGVASLSCGDDDFVGTDVSQNGCFIVDLQSDGRGYTYYRYGSSAAAFTKNPEISSIPSLNTTAFNDVVWGQEVWYNGTKIGTTRAAKDSEFANNTRKFYLFKGRNVYNGTAKVSYLRMYNGTNRTELVRDFRPGVKDGVTGFYDVVGDTFYANAGSGSFDKGLRVAEPNAVELGSNWLNFGTPDPGYGMLRGLAAGEERTFTAPTGVCELDGNLALCTGWKLYKFDSATGKFQAEPFASGSGTTCAYAHPDPAEFVRLEWTWQTDASQATTLKAGEWDDPDVWTSKSVPTKETRVVLDHDVHCSGNVAAKSIVVNSGAVLRFHASTSYSVANSTPDAPGDGSFSFDVAGDVTLAGGSLALHGGLTTPSITNLNLTIGGDLKLSGAARMCVAAAAYAGSDCSLTNLYNTATRLRVGGGLTLSDTAILYTVCDQKVGSPVRIDCTNFVLGASAKVIADERGWHWLAGTADSRRPFTTIERYRYTFARGPGHDVTRQGGGNGGCGSNTGSVTEPAFGASYGNPFAPYLPGSPSGGDSNMTDSYGSTSGGCRGGGVFWLFTAGTAALDGTISATVPKVSWQAGSGGSVWIAAHDFAIGANAKVDVSGGDAGASTPTAAGGGGRVSFAENVPEAVLAALARGESPEGYLYRVEQALMTVDVSGGTSSATDAAESGTATYVTPAAALHFVTVAANPVEVDAVTPKYGVHQFEEDAVETFVSELYGTDPANTTWRRQCLGYVVSNDTQQVEAQASLRCDLTIGTTDLSLTWLWDEIEYLNYFTRCGNGHFELEGQTLSAATTNVYLRGSAANILTAVPDAGYEFVCWTGDVTAEQKFSPSVTLTASRQHHVTGIFRSTGSSPVTRNWKANKTGDFYTASNWEEGVVPGLQDSVVVTSGTCRLAEYVQCANLEVSGNGKVVTARTAGGNGYETNEVLLSGDLRLADAGELQIGATNGSSSMYNTLSVGGNVILSGTAKLQVAAGRRTGAYTWDTGSGFVTIGGDFRLNGTSTYCPNCDGYYGGCVKTTVGGRFSVASGAKVDADARGMGVYYGLGGLGWTGGIGTDGTTGSSHCGRGTVWNGSSHEARTERGGDTYDNAYVPRIPGQQNREAIASSLCRGGGVIRIFAGSMRIDGTLTANGTSCDGGNSSGGTIWLVSGDSVSFGPTAVLSAQGGYSSKWPGMGCGGGGCVAVYEYFTPEMVDWVMAHPTKPLGPYVGDDRPPKRIREWSQELLAGHPSFADAPAPGSAARELTLCWGSVKALRGPRRGLVFLVK